MQILLSHGTLFGLMCLRWVNALRQQQLLYHNANVSGSVKTSRRIKFQSGCFITGFNHTFLENATGERQLGNTSAFSTVKRERPAAQHEFQTFL